MKRLIKIITVLALTLLQVAATENADTIDEERAVISDPLMTANDMETFVGGMKGANDNEESSETSSDMETKNDKASKGSKGDVEPTTSPTQSPTKSPTSSPSSSPSNSPSMSPTSSPSQSPSSSPSSSPSVSPSMSPTSSPSASPSSSPTSTPSDSPTSSPSSSPTGAPSVSPTTSPSNSPSSSPTASPSAVPSKSPTAAPDCVLEVVDLECVNTDDDSIACDKIIPPVTQCEARPTILTMRYNGGNCSQSFNIQPNNLFQCFDLEDGPPPLDEPAYIVAQELKGDFVYFEDIVSVGDTFDIGDGSERIVADCLITVFEDSSRDTVLQSINFHSSCSQNLFLKDKFGSAQVAGWLNDEQGQVDCLQNITFKYTVENTGSVDATLDSLMSMISPPGSVNDMSDDVSGQVLVPSASFDVEAVSEIDLIARVMYNLTASVSGRNRNDNVCSATETLMFEVGFQGLP